ncbi:uncharacterized protein LOC133869126 [Alnus glutinosa]|uniref:uncharacterized protein LOC133869126 n=1 Tax=Alnus glutinosa TaxID=3517 RepID=UPI002D784080|nr:uncharacterized protein LOC133869126 [Alnus glutinosa]
MDILPEESLSFAGTGSSGELAKVILYAQLQDRDKDLVLARKQAEEARAQALESEKILDQVLTNLTKANEAKVALTTRVAETQLEKDSLAADKQALTEKQKEAHARYKKLQKKSHHYNSKSKCLKKQLALASGSEASARAGDQTEDLRA